VNGTRHTGKPECVPEQGEASPLNRTWPAVPGAVAELRGAVAAYARALGIDGERLATIILAVSEAATNVVIHAYTGRDEPGAVHIRAERAGESLCVTVTDEGGGMVPRPDSPGLGLGLPLIAQLANDLRMERSVAGGTELSMCFALGPASRPS